MLMGSGMSVNSVTRAAERRRRAGPSAAPGRRPGSACSSISALKRSWASTSRFDCCSATAANSASSASSRLSSFSRKLARACGERSDEARAVSQQCLGLVRGRETPSVAACHASPRAASPRPRSGGRPFCCSMTLRQRNSSSVVLMATWRVRMTAARAARLSTRASVLAMTSWQSCSTKRWLRPR